MHSKEDKNKTQRVETQQQQQLSPQDIQRSERAYTKELNDFMMGLVQGEKYKKNTIKKLARLLEEAGTVELDKIAVRIKTDLKEAMQKKGLTEQLISDNYVVMILEDKYKQKKHDGASGKKHKETNTTGSNNIVASSSTTVTAPSGPIQSTEEQKPSPQSLQEERDFDDWVNSLYDLTRRLAEQITGYHEDKILKIDDNFKLISETRQYRFDAAKRLADLDLRTVHKEVRRDILLLNDFIEHLEKELDSRKKKQDLISA
jgi:hypothetical protein